MQLFSRDRIFDTVVDTKRIAVSVKTYFRIRTYKTKPHLGYVYLFITGVDARERINLELEIAANRWDKKKERLIPVDKVDEDNNLILDTYMAKLTEIRTVYRLNHRQLSPAVMKDELINGMVRINFAAFCSSALEEDRSNLKKGTYKKNKTVVAKLIEYRPDIPFLDLDLSFFKKYRNYLTDVKKNNKVTVNGNIKVLKKFLRIAVKYGIRINFDIEDIPSGSTAGNRTYLTPEEVKKLFQLYKLPFINPGSKLVLGYFLFACMTGLRISDLQKTRRKNLQYNEMSFVNTKSDVDQYMILNHKAQEILADCPELFVTFFSEKHLNFEIKKLIAMCDIEKHIIFHAARHTFATCFLRAGGKLEHLQKLLKHKKITTTMIYVHILEEEANKEVFVMDKLFA